MSEVKLFDTTTSTFFGKFIILDRLSGKEKEIMITEDHPSSLAFVTKVRNQFKNQGEIKRFEVFRLVRSGTLNEQTKTYESIQ